MTAKDTIKSPTEVHTVADVESEPPIKIVLDSELVKSNIDPVESQPIET